MRTDSWTDVPSVFEGLSSSQQLLAPAALVSGKKTSYINWLVESFQKPKQSRQFYGHHLKEICRLIPIMYI